jgi:hypothetical protein
MREEAVKRVLIRKALEEHYLTLAAKHGGWDYLAGYLIDEKGSLPVGRDMRAFLSAVLRQRIKPPNLRTRQALNASIVRISLAHQAMKGGAKNREAAINEAVEKASELFTKKHGGSDIRTIRRDLSKHGVIRTKLTKADIERLRSKTGTGHDYDINPTALTEHVMGPDTR